MGAREGQQQIERAVEAIDVDAQRLMRALTLLGQVVSQRAYSRSRRIALAAVTILVGLGLAATLQDFDRDNVIASIGRFRASLAGYILVAPLEVFPRILTARDATELTLWTAVATAMVAGLYGLAIGLDANYLEAAQQVAADRGIILADTPHQ